MENRCGSEKESTMRRKERREAKDGCSFQRGWNQSGVCKVCVCVCVVQRVRLTVCVRVAVEALAGRGAAEVWVAEQSGLSWRVTQAVFCFNVCVRTHDIENCVDNLTRQSQKQHWPFAFLRSSAVCFLDTRALSSKNRRRHYIFGNFCQQITKKPLTKWENPITKPQICAVLCQIKGLLLADLQLRSESEK